MRKLTAAQALKRQQFDRIAALMEEQGVNAFEFAAWIEYLDAKACRKEHNDDARKDDASDVVPTMRGWLEVSCESELDDPRDGVIDRYQAIMDIGAELDPEYRTRS